MNWGPGVTWLRPCFKERFTAKPAGTETSTPRNVILVLLTVGIVLTFDFAMEQEFSDSRHVVATVALAVASLSLPLAGVHPRLAVALMVAGGAGFVSITERVGLISLITTLFIGLLTSFASWKTIALCTAIISLWAVAISLHLHDDLSYLPPLALFAIPAGTVGLVLNRTFTRLRDSRLAHADLELKQRKIRERERASLARDLHDVVAHQLTVISLVSGSRLRSQDVEKLRAALREINGSSREALVELRTLLEVLRGSLDDPLLFGSSRDRLTHMGLREGVEHLASTLNNLGFYVDTQIEFHAGDPARTSVVEPALRIVRESCTNVAKHAQTESAVLMRVETTQNWLKIAVESRVPQSPRNPTSDPALSSGQGVLGITERAEVLGGSARVGQVGETWTVWVSLPMN